MPDTDADAVRHAVTSGPASNVDDVLDALDAIIKRSLVTGSRLGFFAALYRKVTAKVKEGVDSGFFDDNERMAKLDVVFANRYLSAVARHEHHRSTTRSWHAAFVAAERRRLIVLQHLLLGINAHINLDLGIACAKVAPGEALPGLRGDFDRINEILASLVGTVQQEIGEISPWIGVLNRLSARREDELINFSVTVARTQAWAFARELAALPREHWDGPVNARDRRVDHVAHLVVHPGALTPLLLLVRSRERNDVRRVIAVLNRVSEPDLRTVEANLHDRPAGSAG